MTLLQLIKSFLIGHEVALQVTGTNSFVLLHSKGIVYRTIDGTWRLKGNISGTKAASTGCVLTIAGVVFRSLASGTLYQVVTYNNINAGGYLDYAHTNPGNGNISTGDSANSTLCGVAFDVELNAKPTCI